MFRTVRLGLVVAALSLFGACGDGGGTGVQEISATGLWSGSVPNGQYLSLSLRLSESSTGSVTGDWEAEKRVSGGGVGGFRTDYSRGPVSGKREGSQLTLNLTASEESNNNAVLQGTITGERSMTVKLSQPNYPTTTIVLVR